MGKFKCPTCLGTYEDPQPNGARYYHACPPIGASELERMPEGQVRQLYPELPAAFTRGDLERVCLQRAVNRDNHIDENIAPGVPGRFVKPNDKLDDDDLPRVSAPRKLTHRRPL